MYICIYGYQMLGRQCYQVGLLLSVMLCVTAYLYISSFSHSCLSLRDALLFLSLLVVTQIRSHIAGSSPPLPTTVRALHFYCEKISALYSLVDSRRIKPTPARRSQHLILIYTGICFQVNSKSHHGGGFELTDQD